MNPLKEAVLLMSKEEARAFKLYAQKVSVEGSRKDLDLFDLIRKNSAEYDEEAMLDKIYADAPRNTFHRLKSRLLDTINRSMFDLYLEKNDALKLYHLLGIIDYYLGKRHFGLAHWFLRKAERLATKMEHYEALDIILNEYIRLSNQLPDIDPIPFILRRKANQAELQRIRQLDDVLAAARHRVMLTQNYGDHGSDIMDTLSRTVFELLEDSQERQSPVLRIKLFQAIARLLLDRREYKSLQTYALSMYEEFEAEGIFQRHNHEFKLQMITYIINAANKIEDYQLSLKYAHVLRAAMYEFDGALLDKYRFFYYNALIINYFKTDLERATEVLEEMMRNEKIMATPFLMLFVYSNMALVWYERKDLKKSVRYFVQTAQQDAYKVADPGLQLRISMAELLVRQELRQYEVMLTRLRQVSNDFKAILGKDTYARERDLLKLLQRLNESPEPWRDEKLRQAAVEFVQAPVPESAQDAELIGYNEFLIAQLRL